MVAELKMVCAEHRTLMHNKNETVLEVNDVAAICVCMETLAAQEQLDHM
jgi:hypothetical protein